MVVWLFYGALERLLKAGPTGKTTTPRIPECDSVYSMSEEEARAAGLVDRNVAVRNLVVNVVSPVDDDEDLVDPGDESQTAWWSAKDDGPAEPGDEEQAENLRLQSKIMRPEWPADYLQCDLQGLLAAGYQRAKYGSILYERIGRIELMMDGKAEYDFPLGDMLSNLEFNDSFGDMPSESRRPHFQNWKEDTI